MQKELIKFRSLPEALSFVRRIVDGNPYLVGKEISYTIKPHKNIYRVFVNRKRINYSG